MVLPAGLESRARPVRVGTGLRSPRVEQSGEMLALILGMSLALAGPAAPPQARAAAPPAIPAEPDRPQRADAYFEFLHARRLEADGDVEAAVDALRRAAAADPASAEVRAELAALFARQNRAADAIEAAQAALAVDPDNAEAHWVLGSVYSALAQQGRDAQPTATEALDRAIEHLEKARPGRRYDPGLSLALGRLYLRKADYEKALGVLVPLGNQEPGIAEVGYLLAQAYEGTGQRKEAIGALRQALDNEPRFFRGWLMLGELLEKDRQWAEAAEAYGHASSQNPRNVELKVRQAQALLNAGDAGRARDLLRALANDAPTETAVLYLLSEAERQLKAYDEAESAARRLIALDPKGTRGPYLLALVHAQRREHRAVIETLAPVIDRAAAAGPLPRSMVPLLVLVGFAHQERGEAEAAVEIFERARAASPGEAVLDIYLAQALVGARQGARALSLLEAVRRARPDDVRLARLEAEALKLEGQSDRAFALLEQEAARRPDNADAQLALAAFYAGTRAFDRAARVLDEADRRFPGNVLVAFQRGAVLEQQQRYEEAERAFREALARDPRHAPTLNYLGYMLAERGVRLDEAIELVQRALESDPFNGSYLDSLGWAYFKRGDLQRARPYLERAADQMPRNSVVQDHWGDLLWALDDRTGAVAAWERALAGDRESIDPAAIERKLATARGARP